MHISSSYAEILGETNFRTREIPHSGSKAEDGERKKRERILQGKVKENAQKSAFFRKKIKITQIFFAYIF